MLFNSISFLCFFPVVSVLFYALPHKIRPFWLLVASYCFYMSWNPKYAVLILTSTVITYLSGLLIQRTKDNTEYTDRKRKLMAQGWMLGSLIINLGILSYFKYTNFMLASVAEFLSAINIEINIPAFDILLPVGISFYTFQALGYTIDVYRQDIKAERNFIDYALFVSFFPQLVAGPIERSGNLLSQIHEKHKFNFELVREGLMLMLWGFFLKMVIADRIAILVNAVYGNYVTYSGFYLIVASVLFAFQIYCDFAGYSVIAMGAAKVMGFTLIDNFNSPYFSRTVSEFWRRWHISLFGWFRDYIYIPLGGSRQGKKRKYLNIMIVFLVSGLWHGASWSFVIWGGLNGLYQVIGDATKPFRDRLVSDCNINREAFSHKLLQTLCTFVLVDFTWIFFRAGTVSTAIEIIKSIFTANNVWILFDDSLFNLGLSWRSFAVMLVSIAILTYADMLKKRGIVIRDVLVQQGVWLRWLVLLAGIFAVFTFGIWGSGYEEAAFIYFQF